MQNEWGGSFCTDVMHRGQRDSRLIRHDFLRKNRDTFPGCVSKTEISSDCTGKAC